MAIESDGLEFDEPVRGGSTSHRDADGVWQKGPSPAPVIWHRCSIGAAPGGLREAFESAVADILGPGAYFRAIQGRVLNNLADERYRLFQAWESQRSAHIAGSTPLGSELQARAEASAGFARLNARLKRVGYRATLKADEKPHSGNPYLRLEIQSF